jgi:chromosome segregation ATPase
MFPALPDIEGLKANLNRVQGRKDFLLRRQQDIKRTILDLTEERSLLEHVQELLRGLIDAEIEEAVSAVEDLTTEALRAVFNDQDLSVRADVGTERGKVSVSLLTSQKIGEEETVGQTNEAFGGSVTTVQSVLLRVLIMLRRGLRPILVLDESLPAFDPNYAANMGQFLVMLCDRLGLDILMVTHNPFFFEAAQRAYKVKRHQGAAKFELVGATK